MVNVWPGAPLSPVRVVLADPREQGLVPRHAPRGYAPAGQPGAAQPSHAYRCL